MAAKPGDQIEQLAGTSMAAAHVSGGWALLKQTAPDGTVEALMDLLNTTGATVTGSPLGRLQMDRALEGFWNENSDTGTDEGSSGTEQGTQQESRVE